MTDVDVNELPRAPLAVAGLASRNGWTVRATRADGPPSSVALRCKRGKLRLWAMWLVDDGVRFKSAAAAVVPGGHLPTLTSVKRVLESDPAAVAEWLADAREH